MTSVAPARLVFHSILFAYLSLFLYGLLDNVRGPIFPDLMARFELTNVQGSWFFSLTSFVFMLAAWLAPAWLKKYSYIQCYRWSLVSIGVSQGMFALAPNFIWILIGCVLMGLGVGVLSVMQNVLVLVASPPDKLTRIMNGLHANYAGASLVAPLIVAGVYYLKFDFQTVFWIGVICSGLLWLGTWRVKELMAPPLGDEAVSISSPSKWKLKHLPFSILLSSYVAAEVLISSRFAQFMVEFHQVPAKEGSLWTSAFFMALFAGRICFSLIHFSISTPYLLTGLFSLSAVSILMGIYWSPVFLVLSGLLFGPLYAMTMTLVKEDFPSQMEKVTSSAIVVSGIFIITMHFIAGVITDWVGIASALYLGPLFLMISLAMLGVRRYVH